MGGEVKEECVFLPPSLSEREEKVLDKRTNRMKTEQFGNVEVNFVIGSLVPKNAQLS